MPCSRKTEEITQQWLPLTVIAFVAFAVPTVLFATQVYSVSPPAKVFWLQNSTESSLVCTGMLFLNNWYVCTTGFQKAEQVMLIMSPLQMLALLLCNVNTNFSALTKAENGQFMLKRVIFSDKFITIISC